MTKHQFFDLLSAFGAMTATMLVYRWRLQGSVIDPDRTISKAYLAALVLGAAVGAYVFGTANLWLSGLDEIDRSIVGALFGAIAAVELHKWHVGIRRSTGLIFVTGFSLSVAIGRIGCLLSGLDDNTYGIPTGADWGWDFGDGIPRHPVQLYESLAMAAFLAFAVLALARRQPFFMRNGFYLMVGFYASQRFLWEFLKPYATVVGPLNIFHILCLVLIEYSALMIAREHRLESAIA